MAFKIIFVIAAIIACTHARPGGPAAYSISVPAVDHASVGNTQEHTVKGHLGQSSQSDYSSQVQTAHSQSHVQRSSISNDAGLVPHAHGLIGPGIAAHGLGLGYAGHGLGLAAPVPALAHLGGPLIKSVGGPALVHASVSGHGVHYGY